MINEQLWDFPHDTVLKVMGEADQALDVVLLNILILHNVEHDKQSVSTRPSKNGKYNAVTCQVIFQNKAQVEAVYASLNKAPEIKLFL